MEIANGGGGKEVVNQNYTLKKVKDIVEVEIYDAQGVTLFGNKVKEGVYEAA